MKNLKSLMKAAVNVSNLKLRKMIRIDLEN
jgi:hypothetical protein